MESIIVLVFLLNAYLILNIWKHSSTLRDSTILMIICSMLVDLASKLRCLQEKKSFPSNKSFFYQCSVSNYQKKISIFQLDFGEHSFSLVRLLVWKHTTSNMMSSHNISPFQFCEFIFVCQKWKFKTYQTTMFNSDEYAKWVWW